MATNHRKSALSDAIAAIAVLSLGVACVACAPAPVVPEQHAVAPSSPPPGDAGIAQKITPASTSAAPTIEIDAGVTGQVPPTGAVGFIFGMTIEEAKLACMGNGYKWASVRDYFVCTGVPMPKEDLGLFAQLTFSGGRLCWIILVDFPLDPSNVRWSHDYDLVVKTLEDRYGKPTGTNVQIDGKVIHHATDVVQECRGPQIVQCVASKRAHSMARWDWADHQIIMFFMGDQGKPSLKIHFLDPEGMKAFKAQGF